MNTHRSALEQSPCPGPCNVDFRKAENLAAQEVARAAAVLASYADTDPERFVDEDARPDPAIVNHDVPFHPGRPIWCVDVPRLNDRGEVMQGPPVHAGCTERITGKLRSLADLAAHLTPGQLNTPHDVKVDDRGMGSSTLVHPPTNSPAWDDADDLIRWAVALEDRTRVRLGDTDRTKEKRRLLWPALRYLGGHVTALLCDPEQGEAVGRQILGRHRALERNTGQSRLVHRLPGICPACGRKGLRRADGEDLVKCPTCGAHWDWGHYQLLAAAATQEMKRGA